MLAVIDRLEIGGAQHHLLQLARGLRELGYELTVATSGDGPLRSHFADAGIQLVSMCHHSVERQISLPFAARLTHLAAHFDLIHAHLHASAVAAAIAACHVHRPLVITHHSMSTWHGTGDRLAGRWADRQADAIIAVARNVAEALPSGVTARVVPNGVPLPRERWTRERVAATRYGLGIQPQAYLISFIGRCSPDKNPLLFVEVAARVAFRSRGAHFLLVGDGPLRVPAMDRARALGIGDRFTAPGFWADAGAIHQISDVLTLTSNSECAPLVVLEAMAAERPVVATAVGDVPRQIVHGQTGFVVPPGDLVAMQAALLQLEDPDLRRRFGSTGLRRVQRYFSLERMLVETADVYAKVLDQQVSSRVLQNPAGWSRLPATEGRPAGLDKE